MFRASSAQLHEDIVVYKQHMVPSLSIRVLVACRYAANLVLIAFPLQHWLHKDALILRYKCIAYLVTYRT